MSLSLTDGQAQSRGGDLQVVFSGCWGTLQAQQKCLMKLQIRVVCLMPGSFRVRMSRRMGIDASGKGMCRARNSECFGK